MCNIKMFGGDTAHFFILTFTNYLSKYSLFISVTNIS